MFEKIKTVTKLPARKKIIKLIIIIIKKTQRRSLKRNRFLPFRLFLSKTRYRKFQRFILPRYTLPQLVFVQNGRNRKFKDRKGYKMVGIKLAKSIASASHSYFLNVQFIFPL